MAIIRRKYDSPEPIKETVTELRLPTLHDALVLRADRWLYSQGCSIVIRDPFRTWNTEQPDAIGWRTDVSILVEVKTSRADFLADQKKGFRINSERGMGDWRFYMCPPGIISPEDLPSGWGLLWASDNIVRRIHGFPHKSRWGEKQPFSGNKANENTILTSALRRLNAKGYLSEIYEA